jgi:small glutamine-rich tetratricopeptide repeat-containing protein alpha
VQRYDDAVKDCNMSVKLKPDYAKAYSRLGAALMSLHKYRQAADNGYAHAMRLEPANSEYRANFEKAKAEADAADRGGSSVQPDLSQLFGGGGGGMPDLSAMLGGAGGMEGLAGLMNNPQMMSMAQNMMQNPAFMQMAQGLMGGMAGAPQAASAPASAPAAASNFNPAQLAALANPETLQQLMQHPDVVAIRASDAEAAALLDQLQSQGIGAAMAHMGSPAFNRLLQVMRMFAFMICDPRDALSGFHAHHALPCCISRTTPWFHLAAAAQRSHIQAFPFCCA